MEHMVNEEEDEGDEGEEMYGEEDFDVEEIWEQIGLTAE